MELRYTSSRVRLGAIIAALVMFGDCVDPGVDNRPPSEHWASRPATNSPWTVGNDDLQGRSFGAFPAGTPESDVIRELRAHLNGISERAPKAEVLAVVIFSASQTPSAFAAIARNYGFTTGPMANIVVETPTVYGGEHLTESYLRGEGLAEGSVVTGFSAYSTPAALLRLWNDLPNAVRGVGVAGRRGMVTFNNWKIPRPSEPLR